MSHKKGCVPQEVSLEKTYLENVIICGYLSEVVNLIVMPMHIKPFGVKEEIQLKVPKQGLDKVCVGMAVL